MAFIKATKSRWTGRSFWGIHHEGQKFTSVRSRSIPETGRGTVLISASEDETTKESLAKEFDVKYAAGAGYKLLCVILGIADAYFLSRGTTFRWDLCAPHALVKSIDGGVVNFAQICKTNVDVRDVEFDKQVSKYQLVYNKEEKGKQGAQKWCNAFGFIAYRDANFLHHLLEILNSNSCSPT